MGLGPGPKEGEREEGEREGGKQERRKRKRIGSLHVSLTADAGGQLVQAPVAFLFPILMDCTLQL